MDTNRKRNPIAPAAFSTRMRGYRVVGATLALLVVASLAFAAVHTRTGQILDTLSMESVGEHFGFTNSSSRVLATIVSERVLLAVGILVFLVTLLRRRVALTVRAGLMFASANVTTQAIKYLLPRPDKHVGHALSNSFPSGHVTVVASLTVALIVIVPIGLRTLMTYLSFALTTFVGVSVMALGWHRLSDVIGAIAIVGFFGLLTLPSEWVPLRSRGWGALLAWLSTTAVLSALVSLVVIYRKLPVGSGWVSSEELFSLASQTMPGGYLTVVCLALISGAAGILATGIDRLAGGTPR